MPYYSTASQDRLNTCHPDLIRIFEEVILYFDNTIIYGMRSPKEQLELYMKGRRVVDNKIVIVDKSKVVTYKDGQGKKSKHNYNPSRAVDSAPYPIDWGDTDRMYYYAGWVMAIAKRLREEGEITSDIRWGGDWDRDTEVDDQTFMDLVHFEIV